MRLVLTLIFFQFSLNACMSVWTSQGEEIIVEANIHHLQRDCLFYGTRSLIDFFRTQANIVLNDNKRYLKGFYESYSEID